MACKSINEGIAEYLRAQGVKSIADLVGTLRTGREMQDCAVSG
jgi:dihydroorotate dehydrogenase